MKKFSAIFMAFLFALSPAVTAGSTRSADLSTQPPHIKPLPDTDRLPGVDLAEGLQQLTGTAISPALGVAAVGAWQYFKTPTHLRSKLPWYTNPFVWGFCFFLTIAWLFKDVIGPAFPVLKKPMDALENIEKPVSALLASTAVVPFIGMQMARHTPQFATTDLNQLQLASSFDLAGVSSAAIIIPLALIGFFVVWIASQAINVLIMLSPFPLVDVALASMKGLLLLVIVGLSFLSPLLGAALCLAIIFIAWLIAPWAFRLTVFGTLFSLDILLPWCARKQANPQEPHSFLSRSIDNVPVRTYGRITRSSDQTLIFTYRPWLVLPKCTVTIPAGKFSLSKGLLFPSLNHAVSREEKPRGLVMLLPRYCGIESIVANHLGITEIHDNLLARGLQAIKEWIADTLNFGKAKASSFRSTD